MAQKLWVACTSHRLVHWSKRPGSSLGVSFCVLASCRETGFAFQAPCESFSMKRVDVVVLNWNGWQDTIACLASLQRQDYPHFNLLVVDNGSTDGSVDQIKKAMPALELLQTGANLGFGGGCNAGIKLALARGADYVWLINSDATVDSGALSA